MSWLAQAFHVMAKDLRQARWLVIVYFGVVAMATANALDWTGTSNDVFDLSMFIVVIAGMFLVAFLVQADSPMRSDAFWASRPFHPTAMLAAKLLLAVTVVIGAPLVGQLAALAVNDLPAGTIWQLMAASARNYGLWLLIAMVVAAVTRDLRTFATVLVAFPVSIALSITSSLLSGRAGKTSDPGILATLGPAALTIIGVCAGLGLLVALYRKRALRGAWFAVLAVVVLTLLSIFTAPPSRAALTETLPPLPTADITFQIEVQQVDRAAPRLALRVEGMRSSDRFVGLESGVAILRLLNGAMLRVPISNSSIVLGRPALPVKPGIRWLDRYHDDRPETSTLVQLTRSQQEAIRAGVAGASIEGQVAVLEPRIAATLPFRAGASQRRGGRRLQILTVGDSVTLSVSSIGRTTSELFDSDVPPVWRFDIPQYVLTNDVRGEAIVVRQGGSSSSSDAFVIPGAWRRKGTVGLRLSSENPVLQTDGAWFAESKLVMIDWVLRGRSSFHVEATVR